MGRELRRRGILASVAHTDAVYDEVVRAHEAGYTHMTHLYSAMSSVTRRNARRYAGAVEAAYLIDAMTVEIIADGVHLPEALLRFVYKFKGADRTALCTDAMRGAGMPDGESVLGSLRNGRRVLIEEGVAKRRDDRPSGTHDGRCGGSAARRGRADDVAHAGPHSRAGCPQGLARRGQGCRYRRFRFPNSCRNHNF
jgi:N-acetylglucosamine-6-phosphate deacetylase